MEENITDTIGVVGDEVGCLGVEGDEATTTGDVGEDAGSVGLLTACGDTDPLKLTGESVEKEDVPGIVGIVGDKVSGFAVEGNITAVAGKVSKLAAVIALYTPNSKADTFGSSEQAVIEENVFSIIGVIRHKVGGSRVVDDETAVSGDYGPFAGAVGLGRDRANADAFDEARVRPASLKGRGIGTDWQKEDYK